MKNLGLLLLAILVVKGANAQEFVYDNLPSGQTSSEISSTGKWCAVNTAPYFGTKSLQDCGKPAPATYLYSPTLPNGVYNVFVRWVANKKLSNKVPVSVTSSDYFVDFISGVLSTVYYTTDFSVNETVSSNGWYYLGQFTSVGGAGAISVSLSNANGDTNTDGIRLVKVADYPVPCNPATGVGCR